VAVPSLDEYAEALCGSFLSELKPNDFPRVILETGRAIVDGAGFLISTVHAVKRLPDGRKAYVIDAGLNTLFTSFWYKHNIEIDRDVQGPYEECAIYGPLCMNIDVIEEQARLPLLSRGARLILSPVGAYNNTQWMQFISYRPGVVLVGESGALELIRKPEQLEDIVRKEYLPDRLKPGP
jgi:diaminopimelate decarboxylase